MTFTWNIASIDVAVKLEIERDVKPDFLSYKAGFILWKSGFIIPIPVEVREVVSNEL